MSDTLQLQPELRVFLERMLEASDITTENAELYRTMMEELSERLAQHITLDLLNYMPDDKMAEFEKLMESNPSQMTVVDFLKQHVPRSEELVAQSLISFKDTFIASAKA